VFVPERRRLGESIRDAAPLPSSILAPLTGAVRWLLADLPDAGTARPAAGPRPVPVEPGTLGSWTEPAL
jgi:hypothetical protein